MMVRSSPGNNRPSSTIVIGLGNPILGDDGVGWKVAEAVRDLMVSDPRFQIPIRRTGSKVVHHYRPIEVDFLSLGGLGLMERMVGYERAILVDSMETGQCAEGSVQVIPLEDLPDPAAGHSASAHDTSLLTALKTGREMGLVLPSCVTVVAIEAKNTYDFSEELSPAIAAAVPVAVNSTLELLSLKKEPA